MGTTDFTDSTDVETLRAGPVTRGVMCHRWKPNRFARRCMMIYCGPKMLQDSVPSQAGIVSLYRKRRRRQFIAAGCFFASIVAAENIFGDSGFLWVLPIAVFGGMIFSAFNWRCPKCAFPLGRGFHSRCPSCKVSFREEAEAVVDSR
jgi:hypothetical protein